MFLYSIDFIPLDVLSFNVFLRTEIKEMWH